MVDIKTEIIIHCPRYIVSEYSTNPDNAPEWYVNIKSVEWKTSKPLSVGSQIAFVAHFMGKRLSYIYEIDEMSDKKFVMRTARGPFPMETTYQWEAVDAHTTRMTLRNRGGTIRLLKIICSFYVNDDEKSK